MGDRGGWARTVLGWFVVRDGEGPEAESAPDDGAALPSVEPVGDLPRALGGAVDFDAVFVAFGIDSSARDRLAKADGLLATLPGGTDPTVKRQIVEASLKAFGVPFDSIIETACEELQALDAYQRRTGGELQQFCDESGRRIASLEEEIRSVRAEMERQVDSQKKVIESCNARKLEVQRVLEFFGPEAVGRVVRESPKLIDPSAPRVPETRAVK